MVVGEAGDHPVRYRDGGWERLPEPDGYYVRAVAVNGAGEVVGWAVPDGSGDADEDRHQHPVRWPADRPDAVEEIEVPFLGGFPVALADDGTVLVAGREVPDGRNRGFVGRPDGTWTALDQRDEWLDVTPVALGGGAVVGTGQTERPVLELVEWDLDGHVVRVHPTSSALDVNSSGQVLGVVNGLLEGMPAGKASVWRGGALQAEFPVAGDARIDAVAIDDDGAVVGRMAKRSGLRDAPVVGRCS
ncbi:hypothetical protein [Umezawaea sp. NPDC059074]|uniref:hypothetical protein n=1 Tax=Umezawaea sp. NPDC059074 TaxID=3346716 RepID=UPI00369106CD